jgi:hypothetical protein
MASRRMVQKNWDCGSGVEEKFVKISVHNKRRMRTGLDGIAKMVQPNVQTCGLCLKPIDLIDESQSCLCGFLSILL